MRKSHVSFFVIAGCSVLMLMQGGCLSVPDSPGPRLYMPRVMDKSQITQTFSLAPNVVVAVGPVRVPEYLNRPQMVTLGKDNLLDVAQFDRWAESLDLAMLRLLDEDLALMLPQTNVVKFTWNILIPVKYNVVVDVIQLESRLDQDLLIVAQWTVVDLENKQMVVSKRWVSRQPITPHNYSGLSEALSISCANLSSEIAQELSAITSRPCPVKKTK
jgi:uncharacterized lipoprotein YmbA